MTYLILTCRKTLDFYRWGEKDYGLWIPLSRQLRHGRWEPVAAMPGYIFCPLESRKELILRAPSCYAANPLYIKGSELPARCSVEVLREMQSILNRDFLVPLQQPEAPEYWVGQEVIITAGPFNTIRGVIEKVRKSTVRLVTRIGYISVPPAIISAVRNN